MLALIARAADPGGEEDAGSGEAGTLFGAAEVTGVDVVEAGVPAVEVVGELVVEDAGADLQQ